MLFYVMSIATYLYLALLVVGLIVGVYLIIKIIKKLK